MIHFESPPATPTILSEPESVFLLDLSLSELTEGNRILVRLDAQANIPWSGTVPSIEGQYPLFIRLGCYQSQTFPLCTTRPTLIMCFAVREGPLSICTHITQDCRWRFAPHSGDSV